MARNVEVKARAADWDGQKEKAASLASSREELSQEDVFFSVPKGRLKLRLLGHGGAQLIFYERPDAAGPKTSRYRIVPVTDPAGLRSTLAAALGEKGVVRKQRTVFHVGRARVHFDDVEGLGRFIELEVVLEAAESEAEGKAQARELMEKLGISPADLVQGAYADLKM